MRRFTMNQVARANLRHNRKAYFSLAIGIFLAVYLACTACLCIYGTMQANDEKMARKVGWADTLLPNASDVTDDQLRNTGYFDKLGHIYVTASVNDSEVFIGRYDEMAESLMYRQCVEGRMPEKPGEIAAELSALDKLELEEVNVGDTLTFTLTPFGGMREQRTFLLVGILSEQTAYLNSTWRNSASGTDNFPSLLTHPDEPDCQYGAPVIHRVMTNRLGVTLSKIQANETIYQLGSADRVSRISGKSSAFDDSNLEFYERVQQVLLYVMLGGALLLSTCVAIASAMESMLAQKTEDIGMLRAVGATKRQIRRLFGRDAWLLALTALPVGAALGCGTVWLLSRLMPGEILFSPAPWLLIPVLGIAGLCVLLSSMMPLRRASSQLPMGVLRDTDTLRKAKRFRSQKRFKATQLIASRQFRLHPMRQMGSACMAGLMLLCALLLGEMSLSMNWDEMDNQAAFSLSQIDSHTIEYEPFAMIKNEDSGLTLNDMNQLRTLPMVARVDALMTSKVILALPEKVPDYLRTVELPLQSDDSSLVGAMDIYASGRSTHYLNVTDATVQDDFFDEWTYRNAISNARQMRVLQRVTGTQSNLYPLDVYIASLDHTDFAQQVVEGDIDLAALDAGREVLIYAPNIVSKAHADGGVVEDNKYFDHEIDPAAWDVVLTNDYFHAGQELPIMQLCGKTPDWFNNINSEEQLLRYYDEMDSVSFSPKVGAVLKGRVQVGNLSPFYLCIITTEKGAAALGITSNGAGSVSVTLTGDPDPASEEMLESAITRIGLRKNMEVTNNLVNLREFRAYQAQALMLFVGMVMLFFAVSVSMQVTNASRRIRADERMVGTLRAVGADARALLSCYRLPTMISALCGFALAALAYILMAFLYPFGFPEYHLWLLLAALFLAALNMWCAMAGIRGQLRRVVSKSIVENIREL